MTTSRIAVLFSIVFSLFLLSYARHGQFLSDEPSSTAVGTEESIDRTAVFLPHEKPSDVSHRIAHSLRLPLDRHFHHSRGSHPLMIRLRRGCRHHARRPDGRVSAAVMEIPYGDDMLRASHIPKGFPVKKRPFKIQASPLVSRDEFQQMVQKLAIGIVSEEDVRGWNPELTVVEHKKKKNEREEIEHEEEEEEHEDAERKKKIEIGEGKEEEEMEKKQEGGFMERIQEFVNRF